jgi:L-cysteate sulfo-lyase
VLVLHRSRAEDVQGNLLLAHLVGADIHFVEQHNVDAAVTQRNALRDHMYTLADQYITEGRKPYVLESSFHPLGAIGFVDFALELNEQLEAIDMRVDQVYLASAGATQAGLVLGLKFLRSAVEVVGISYTRSIGTDISDRVAALANQAAERLDIATRLVSDDIINVSFAGEGYGVPSPESFEAIEIVAKTEGIFLDPVYTSKAMAGLAAHIKSGRIAPGSTIVFVHSGGTAALFAYQSELTGAGLI